MIGLGGSYLTGCRQYTTVNGYISDPGQTLCRVSQVSVLRPLLFLLYVNDLYQSFNEIHFYSFADLTSVTYTNRDLKTLESKLTLNAKKSNYIIFHPRQKTLSFHLNIRVIATQILANRKK